VVHRLFLESQVVLQMGNPEEESPERQSLPDPAHQHPLQVPEDLHPYLVLLVD